MGRIFFNASAVLFFSIIVLSGSAPVSGQPSTDARATAGAEAKNNKLYIRADRLVSQRQSNYIQFIGNVRVDDDEINIRSSELKIFYEDVADAKATVSKNNIQKIVATGTVTIVFDNRTARCDQAVYRADTQTLVLTGEAVEIKSENNSIIGNKITFNQQTGQIIVDGTQAQRVNAVIHRNQKTSDPINDPGDL